MNLPIRFLSYTSLIHNLIKKDLQVKFHGSFLGFVWSLAAPTASLVLYSFIFTRVIPAHKGESAQAIVIGLLHWNLFLMTISQGLDCFERNKDILRKVYFPRLIIPLSSLFYSLINWSVWAMVFFITLLLTGLNIGFGQIAYLPFLIMFIVFCFSCMLMISTLYVYFRDIKHLWEVTSNFVLWLTPVFYPFDTQHKFFDVLIRINPLSYFISLSKNIFLGNETPIYYVGVIVVTTLISVLLAGIVFIKQRDRIAEVV